MSRRIKIVVMITFLLLVTGLFVVLKWFNRNTPVVQPEGSSGGVEFPLLDETGQTPRVIKPATTSLEGPSEDSNAVDREPQDQRMEAERPRLEEDAGDLMTENDYSFWDSTTDVARVGLLRKVVEETYGFFPNSADRRRIKTVRKELRAMESRGVVSLEPKDSYIRWESESGEEFRYIAAEELPAYDALKKEEEAIVKRSTRKGPKESTYLNVTITTDPLEDGVVLEYYRRSNGDLMRQATFPDGKVKRWVAGPPVDLSMFSQREREEMRSVWRDE